MGNPLFTKTKIFDSQESAKRTTWGPMLPFLAIVILFLGQIITLVPVFEMELIAEEDLEKYPNIIYMLLAPFSAMILITALWVKKFEGRTLASTGLIFNKKISFREFRIGYVYGLLMASIIVLGIWSLGGYKLESSAALKMVDAIPLLILLVGFIVQSGAEEYLFRGWLFSRLAERYNLFIGITINSVLFTLVHLPGVDFSSTSPLMLTIGIVMTILFSVFLSLIVIKQKSIWGAAAWHAAWNWIFINGFGLATTGIELGLNPIFVDLMAVENSALWLHGGQDGPEGSIITVFVLGLGCVLILGKKIFNNTKGPENI